VGSEWIKEAPEPKATKRPCSFSRTTNTQVFAYINFSSLSQLQSLQEPSKRRAKDFLPVVLDDGAVANDDLIEIPIKYPLHRRAHASAICNGGPIKTRKSATGKWADNQRTHRPSDPRILLAQIE
jgi:hypothetical protein